MKFRSSQTRFGLTAQLLHWSTALLIAATIPIGWWANSMQRGASEQILFDLHFQLGMLIFLLVLARLLWRMLDPAPRLHAGASARSNAPAVVVHVLLYLTVLAVTVSGYVIQVHMRPSLKIFGFQGVPRLFQPPEGEGARALAWYVHHYGFWLLVGLITMHVAAALWHHFVRRDRVLLRMLPVRGRDH